MRLNENSNQLVKINVLIAGYCKLFVFIRNS